MGRNTLRHACPFLERFIPVGTYACVLVLLLLPTERWPLLTLTAWAGHNPRQQPSHVGPHPEGATVKDRRLQHQETEQQQQSFPWHLGLAGEFCSIPHTERGWVAGAPDEQRG